MKSFFSLYITVMPQHLYLNITLHKQKKLHRCRLSLPHRSPCALCLKACPLQSAFVQLSKHLLCGAIERYARKGRIPTATARVHLARPAIMPPTALPAPHPGLDYCVLGPDRVRDFARVGPCESGGIGRRTRFRIWRRKAWGFEPPLSHHKSFFSSPCRKARARCI